METSLHVLNFVALVGAAVLVLVAVFLLLREFWTWYWKQSQQLEVLKEIRDGLRLLAERDAPPAPPAPPALGAPPAWPTPPANASTAVWQRPADWLPGRPPSTP